MFDYCVIGGGILGLATARELLLRYPNADVVLIEKEKELGLHQTGRNSGVIHSGIYYKPKTLKAELCQAGARATKEFCDEANIPYEIRGKLVVATTDSEMARMQDLRDNANDNRIAVDRLDERELRRREPNIIGKGALFIAETGIVNYRVICDAMAQQITARGGTFELGSAVDRIAEGPASVIVRSRDRSWESRFLVACAGLQSDRIARLAGMEIDYKIVPFRGEYFELSPQKSKIVRHLIYPVPDPALPFLGIHLTPMIDGSLTVGPNAVLGLSREGYAHFAANARDMASYLTFLGFWRAARDNWRPGLVELQNAVFRSRYLAECQKYCPSIALDDLRPRAAGVRAQAIMRDGSLAHDFLFLKTSRMLHVGNAPSPAATSAIPIARMIAARAATAN
jgi:(S)-2-hydroxyglutarate dehydrogenase